MLTETLDYDAFGRLVRRTGTTKTPFQYIGGDGYYTTDFGLINARHRWYMPETGQWLSREPLWDGSNPYTCVGHAPTVLVDPTRLAPKWYMNMNRGEHLPLLGGPPVIAVTDWRLDDAGRLPI